MQGLSESSFIRIKCYRTYAMYCQRYDSLLCKRNLLRITKTYKTRLMSTLNFLTKKKPAYSLNYLTPEQFREASMQV